MFLHYIQYFNSFVLAIAGFLGAILGIQKFFEVFTKKGRERVEARKNKQEQRIQQISEDTANKLMEKYSERQDECLGEIHERLEEVSERLDDIESVNRSQNDAVRLLNEKVDMNEIDRIRHEILYFASQCRKGAVFSPDDFNHIIDIHDKYERLLKANNLTNGQMDVDFNFITSYYNTLPRDGKF